MSTNVSFTGNIPEIYDSCLGPILFEPHAQDLIERIRSKNFISVLELACGTGIVTQYLHKVLPSAKITATDLNPDMLKIAKQKIRHSNIEFKVADMQEIPFDNSVFDLVICQFGFMFVPDKGKAYNEIYRVLKPGGTFLFNTWNKIETNGPAQTAHEVINSFFDDNPITFYLVPFSYCDETEIRNHLNAGGFKNIVFINVKKDGNAVSAADAAQGIVKGNPVIISINERAPDLVPVIIEKLTNVLSEKFGASPMKFSLNAIVIETYK